MPTLQRTPLLDAGRAFCDSIAGLADDGSAEDIFSRFSANDVLVLEHGLPQLAPFLGREFHGREGAREYLDLIASCLSFRDMHFSDYVVDPVEGKVSVRGAARFTWTKTGQAWDEVFTYVLAFDGDCKVTKYEIWADSGAAYLARTGQL